ncbi:hypothetical protein AMELA_G00107210 [Ameiurus melas]|uniref:Caspase-8 n=1 Tax=Ameiurus melas TaxID=219545 RepID=A0A7J6AWF1_AMEME|nr:hypothetical protein AMELA_G00107210 [Ameiurus melas]
METVRKNKVSLINTLSTDASFVLQHVQSNSIINQRDYNKLNQPNHTQEMIIINLLDTVMGRGDETCQKLLKLLEKEELQKNFPQLKNLFTPDQRSHDQRSADQKGPAKPTEIGEYKMSSEPRGVCLIINNMDFHSPHQKRNGSEKDEESLVKVFKWLGFTEEVHRNQTAEQMKTILRTHSRNQHHGDCFVCCILSHGSADGVIGTDGGKVTGADIYEIFNGMYCPSLINKPKVFFIQACRGQQYQPMVKVQSDGYKEVKGGEAKVKEEELETDPVQITIPAEADFLVARSTVKGYYSFRTSSGSWFIQSLCEQLTKHCPAGEDIYTILLRVNKEISEKTGLHNMNNAKQMPVQKITLRNKLVFRVPQ